MLVKLIVADDHCPSDVMVLGLTEIVPFAANAGAAMRHKRAMEAKTSFFIGCSIGCSIAHIIKSSYPQGSIVIHRVV